jgi:hypothetical protein
VGGRHQLAGRADRVPTHEAEPAGPQRAAPAGPPPRTRGATQAVTLLGPLIGNRAVVQLLRMPGGQPRAQRLIQVQNIDYKPQANRFDHSTLTAQAVNAQVQQTGFAAVMNAQEKPALLALDQQNLVAPDIPQLATLIIQHLANSNPAKSTAARLAALTQRRADLEFALGQAAPQEVSDKEAKTFMAVLDLATTKSRSKGATSGHLIKTGPDGCRLSKLKMPMRPTLISRPSCS